MKPKRKYELKQRADEMAATRLRITEAAVELHGTVGPARTTLSAIAKRAGVQRHTVYRHFPTEADLFGACSSHYFTTNPWPDLKPWRKIDDPQQRLAQALDELYTYYERTEPMFSNVLRDAELVQALRPTLHRYRTTWPKRPRSWRPAGPPAAGDDTCSPPPCTTRSTSKPGAHSQQTDSSPEARPSSSSAHSSPPQPRHGSVPSFNDAAELRSNAALPTGRGMREYAASGEPRPPGPSLVPTSRGRGAGWSPPGRRAGRLRDRPSRGRVAWPVRCQVGRTAYRRVTRWRDARARTHARRPRRARQRTSLSSVPLVFAREASHRGSAASRACARRSTRLGRAGRDAARDPELLRRRGLRRSPPRVCGRRNPSCRDRRRLPAQCSDTAAARACRPHWLRQSSCCAGVDARLAACPRAARSSRRRSQQARCSRAPAQ